MSSGFLGSASLAAATLTAIYGPVPANNTGTVNINLCNTGNTAAKVRIAISSQNNPVNVAASDWMEYDRSLANNDSFERTGEPIGAGEYVYVQASQVGVTVRVSGFIGAA